MRKNFNFKEKFVHNLDDIAPISCRIGDIDGLIKDSLFDMHYFLEIGIVLSGRIERRFQGKSRVLKANNVWLSGLWQPAGYKMVQQKCSILIILLLPEMLSYDFFPSIKISEWLNIFLGNSDKEFQFTADNEQFLSIKNRLINLNAREDSSYKQFYLYLAFLELLSLISEKILYSSKQERSNGGSGVDLLLPALHLISDQFGVVSLEEAASACGMSRESFRKKFKESLKISFGQFTLRYRIQQVAHELMTTKKPIKAIADKFGFVDSSHLHRHFIRFYNKTPKEFRSQKSFSSMFL